MVNPGAFCGKRKVFLMDERENYAVAVQDDRAAEQVADIFRRYLKRFPITLADDVEPTNEELAKVDDSAPDPDPVLPDKDSLPPDEYAKAIAQSQSEGEKLISKQKQIRRWLRYQYSKMHDLSAKDSGKENPYTIMLHRLTGISVSKPRKAQAFSLWAKANSEKVKEAWDLEMKTNPVTAGGHAAKLNSFKSKLFKKESKEVQQEWAVTADEEYEEALKEFTEKIEGPVSKDLADMQRCLESLSSVVQPFIEMIGEATGCVVTCIVAGPQPADRGRLHVSSFHAGKTLGTVKQNFVQAERANYRKFVVPMFGNFLKRCFTLEMCRARALPSDTLTLEGLGFALEDQGVAHHVIEGEMYNDSRDRIALTNMEAPAGPRTSAKSKAPPPVPAAPPQSPSRASTPRPSSPPPARAPSCRPAPPVPSLPPSRAPSRQPTPTPTPPLPPSRPTSRQPTPVLPLPPSKAPSTAPTPAPSLPPSRAPSRQPTPMPPLPPSKAPSCQPTPAPPLPPSNAPSRQPTPVPPLPLSKVPSRQPTPVPPPTPSRAMSLAALSIVDQHKTGAEAGKDALKGSRKRRRENGGEESGVRKRGKKGESAAASEGGPSVRKSSKKSRTAGDGGSSKATSSTEVEASTDGAGLSSALPNNAPKWAVDAVTILTREKLTPAFGRLVDLWIHFETQEKFTETVKFGASQRPQPVHDWIARGRSATFKLQRTPKGVDPVKEFEKKYWAWWCTLQPKFRPREGNLLVTDDAGSPLRDADGDWEGMRRSGPNGWLSIVAGLCFWSWRLKDMKTDGHREKAAAVRARESWTKAVEDVEWVLGHLM